MKRMNKSLALTVLALVATPLFLAPAASALIVCEGCPLDPPPYMTCRGYCNGIRVLFCEDWINMGCPILLLAPPSSPLDAVFPKPSFLLPEAIPFTPVDGGAACGMTATAG